MARTIADVDLLFHVVSGPLDTDPLAGPVSYRAVSHDVLKATPIGYFEDDGLIPVTTETRQAVQSAIAVLRDQGFRFEAFCPPSLEAARKLWYTLIVRCGATLLEPTSPKADRSPVFDGFLDIAHADPPLTATELLGCLVRNRSRP